jgi:hypothetical protein
VAAAPTRDGHCPDPGTATAGREQEGTGGARIDAPITVLRARGGDYSFLERGSGCSAPAPMSGAAEQHDDRAA